MTTNSNVVQIASAEPDQAKIGILRRILERLESGEQFTSMCVLLSNCDSYEGYKDGRDHEVIVAATRIIHIANKDMDYRQEISGL